VARLLPLSCGFAGPLAVDVSVSEDRLTVWFEDGRSVSVPLAEYPRLAAATPAQRSEWVIEGFGTAIRWEEIDEDVGVWELLGVPEEMVFDAAGFTKGMPAE
jgi:hypothetical protein